jgi:hypothetical protein
MNKKSSILSKIRELFAQEMMGADYATTDGKIIRCLGDSLRIGERVAEVVSGKEQDIFDGTYRLNDGKILEVAAGVIKGITEVEQGNVSNTGQIEQMGKEEMPDVIIEKMEDYKNEIESKLTDGTEVKVLTKGDALSVGDMVLVKDAEGNYVKAPEGKHELEGGLTIAVDAEGFINELETAETADDMEGDEMRRMFEALEQLTSVVTNLKEKFESVEKTNSKLTERFEKFAAEPSTGSVATPKKELSRTATKQERAKYFGSI